MSVTAGRRRELGNKLLSHLNKIKKNFHQQWKRETTICVEFLSIDILGAFKETIITIIPLTFTSLLVTSAYT